MSRFNVKKVAVLGAGVMGAQIAAHLVNVKVPVVLFDLPASAGPKSAIAEKAIANLKKLKPSPIGVAADADLIQPANYEEHMKLLKDCDLVIEAIAEQQLFMSQNNPGYVVFGCRRHHGGRLFDGLIHGSTDHPQHLARVGADRPVGDGHHPGKAILHESNGNALATETVGQLGRKRSGRRTQAVMGHQGGQQSEHIKFYRLNGNKERGRVQSVDPERMSSSY